MAELKTDAKVENLDIVLDFVNEELEVLGCPMKESIRIDVSLEEMFVNIAHYAYGSGGAGWALVQTAPTDDKRGIAITLIDGGEEYDPLKREDPDVTLSAEEREIGGLGIFMVKKSMDEVSYERRDGQNVFTMVKYF